MARASKDRVIVLRREEDGWYATVSGKLENLSLPSTALAQEAVQLVKARYVYDRLGIRPEDVGPAVTLACLAAGHRVLWLRR